MASPVAANLQICKEAKGQGQEVQAKGQNHKGRPQGQLPSTLPSFIYSLVCQSRRQIGLAISASKAITILVHTLLLNISPTQVIVLH